MGKYTKIKADGGPIKGKKKPIIVNDLNDPRLLAYNDSLSLYNNSIKLPENKYKLPKVEKSKYDSLVEKNKKLPYYGFDKDKYDTDKKLKNISSFDDYIYDIYTNKDAYQRNVGKNFSESITKTLPNGLEKTYDIVYKGVPDESFYSLRDPKTGVQRFYMDGKLMNVYNPQIAPIESRYYGKDTPDQIGKISTSASSTGWYSGVKPSFKKGSSKEYVSLQHDVDQYDEYKNPEQPIVYKKEAVKKVSKTEPLNINQIPVTRTNPNTIQGRNIPTPQSPANPVPYDDIQLYTAHQNLANQGRPAGYVMEDGKRREISLDEYNQTMGNKKYSDGGPINTLEGDLISKVLMNRNKGKDFVQRAYAVGDYPNSNMFTSPDPDQFGSNMSHKMGWGTDDKGQAYMYPTVMNSKNEDMKVPNQYANYISSVGYKKATGMPYAMGGRMNQAQQLNAAKMRTGSEQGNSFGDYAGDIGKIMLNNIVSPIEGLTGAEIYNPDYSTNLKGIGDFYGKTQTMAGKMLPQALNMIAPGVGTAVGAVGKGVGNMINSTGEQEMEQMGANMKYAQGGLMHINEGGTHEQNALGGVPIGPNALVEQGETINNDFVFSDRLKPKGSKRTYAQLSKSVDTKYKLRPDDKLSKEAKQMDLDRLAAQQEAQKDEMSTKYMQKAMACGGKIKGFGGQIMGEISQSMNVTNGQNTLLANGGLMSNFMEPEPTYFNPAVLNNQYKLGGKMYGNGGGPRTEPYYNPFVTEDAFTPDPENLQYIDPDTLTPLYSKVPVPQMIQPNIEQISNSMLPGAYNYETNPMETTAMGKMQGTALDTSSVSTQNPYGKVGNTGYLTNLAGNLVKAGMVATSKEPIYNPSVKFDRMNANPAERLAMQEGRREIQGTKDIIRNNATSSGQYLTNASLMGSSAANKLAGTIGGIRQQYDTQNVGIGNQEAQLNQQITSGNNLAKEQFRDNRLNQYNKILDSVIGANQQRFATDVHANNFQNQVISLLKTGVYHMGKVDADGMYEILGPNNEVISKVPPALLKS